MKLTLLEVSKIYDPNNDVLEIPEGYTSIEQGAFSTCKNVKKIILPASLETINGAFGKCENLEEIEVNGANTHFFSNDGVLYRILPDLDNLTYFEGDIVVENSEPKVELVKYPAQKEESSFTVVEGIHSIYRGAFESCNNLIEVKLPSTLRNITIQEMNNCKKLELISVEAPNPIYRSIDGVLYFWPDATTIKGIDYQEEFRKKLYISSGITISNPIDGFHMSSINQTNETRMWTIGLICYPANRQNRIYEVPLGVVELRHIHTDTIEKIVLSPTVNNIQHVNGEYLSKVESSKNNYYEIRDGLLIRHSISFNGLEGYTQEEIDEIIPNKYIQSEYMENYRRLRKLCKRVTDISYLEASGNATETQKQEQKDLIQQIEEIYSKLDKQPILDVKQVLQISELLFDDEPVQKLKELKEQGVTNVQLIDGENDFGQGVEYYYDIDDFINIVEIAQSYLPLVVFPDYNDPNREKIIYSQLFQLLAISISYDHFNMWDEKNHNLYNGFINQRTVCEGFNQMLHHLAKCFGIEHIVDAGYRADIGHAWDLVKLDGEWFENDVTFSSNITEAAGRLVFAYLFKNEDTFKDHDEFIEEPRFNRPKATGQIDMETLFKILSFRNDYVYRNHLPNEIYPCTKATLQIDNIYDFIFSNISLHTINTSNIDILYGGSFYSLQEFYKLTSLFNNLIQNIIDIDTILQVIISNYKKYHVDVCYVKKFIIDTLEYLFKLKGLNGRVHSKAKLLNNILVSEDLIIIYEIDGELKSIDLSTGKIVVNNNKPIQV